NTPTLSVGIQIAHFIEPFRNTLEGAKEAEHAAKHTYERSAFAIQVDKRSGAPILVGGKWEVLDSFCELQHLQELQTGTIPRGLAYALRGVAWPTALQAIRRVWRPFVRLRSSACFARRICPTPPRRRSGRG